MDSKTEYFDRLYALIAGSDEEEDTNNLRDVLAKNRPPTLPSFISSSQPVPETSVTSIARNVPTIHRSTSAPVSNVNTVKETQPLPRKSSLLCHDTPASVTPATSFAGQAPLSEQNLTNKPSTECRTVSTPRIGFVVMSNSTGIAEMLKKRTRKESSKRKASLISLVPEHERIFQGQTFYYIPPDDVAPLRRMRITKAGSYGATWTNEWIASITHVVVDKALTYEDVMIFIKNNLKLETLPSHITIVNEKYPLDCIQYMRLLNPDQRIYRVGGSETMAEERKLPPRPSQQSDNPFELKKQHPRKRVDMPQLPTPGQESTQGTSQGIWLAPTEADEGPGLVESPREVNPVVDDQYVSFGGEFDEMIGVARELQHLPIDDDEDDRPSSSEGPEESDQSGTEDERAARAISKKKRTSTKGSFSQESFSCMTGGTGVALETNPNRRTIEILQEMADYYDRMRDTWRSRAYRMAIGTLKKQSTKISTYDEAFALRTIGKRLAAKIEEIVLTNGLRRLENAKLEPYDKIVQLFLNVYGAGVSQAGEWIRAGYKTLDDLVIHASLTPNQQIGTEHYDDFMARIPRDEVTALGAFVKDAAAALDHSVEVIIGGSYRRGASSSGDIDCLITKPGTSSTKELLPLLSRLVTKLTDTGFLVAALAVPGNRQENGSKWHGACVLPSSPNPVWRRIDFLLVPASEHGAALIYFTGDDIFNRSLRLLASKKGMRLNQRGLYKDVMRGPGRVKLNEGTLVEGAEERRIFAALGVPWRSPENRIMQ